MSPWAALIPALLGLFTVLVVRRQEKAPEPRESATAMRLRSERMDHELWPEQTEWVHSPGCSGCQALVIAEYQRTGIVTPQMMVMVDSAGRPLWQPRFECKHDGPTIEDRRLGSTEAHLHCGLCGLPLPATA